MLRESCGAAECSSTSGQDSGACGASRHQSSDPLFPKEQAGPGSLDISQGQPCRGHSHSAGPMEDRPEPPGEEKDKAAGGKLRGGMATTLAQANAADGKFRPQEFIFSPL